jgi:hypothetical protein
MERALLLEYVCRRKPIFAVLAGFAQRGQRVSDSFYISLRHGLPLCLFHHDRQNLLQMPV